mmetsp:Transcript_25065/g.60792  ORF Transcript_25065/g.60792 Transcript_25065/m.60792 type:complete len:228 (+) Transcript_25065:223-906(+)
MDFKNLKGLLNQISQVLALSLGVVDRISNVDVPTLEDVEHRKDLPIIRNQCLSDHFARQYQHLTDLQSGGNHIRVTCVQRSLDRDDQLGNYRQDLGPTLLQHVVGPLHCEESVRVLLFSKTIEENWKIVVVVQLLDIDLPGDLVPNRSMQHLNWQITAIVETPEFTRSDLPSMESAGCLRWLAGILHLQSDLGGESTPDFFGEIFCCACGQRAALAWPAIRGEITER